MNYNVIEQAAVEASNGLKDIDTELEQLAARKDSLLGNRETLETLGRQLFTVLSMISDAAPAEKASEAALTPEQPAAEPVSFADAHSEATSDPLPQEEATDSSPVVAAPETPAEEAPSFAELLSQSKPYSLRNDGWPAAAPVAQRTLRSLL